MRCVRQSRQIEIVQRTKNCVTEEVNSKECDGHACSMNNRSIMPRVCLSDFLMGCCHFKSLTMPNDPAHRPPRSDLSNVQNSKAPVPSANGGSVQRSCSATCSAYSKISGQICPHSPCGPASLRPGTITADHAEYTKRSPRIPRGPRSKKSLRRLKVKFSPQAAHAAEQRN